MLSSCRSVMAILSVMMKPIRDTISSTPTAPPRRRLLIRMCSLSLTVLRYTAAAMPAYLWTFMPSILMAIRVWHAVLATSRRFVMVRVWADAALQRMISLPWMTTISCPDELNWRVAALAAALYQKRGERNERFLWICKSGKHDCCIWDNSNCLSMGNLRHVEKQC